MSERERRLGENEVLYREVNERVRELHEGFGVEDGGVVEFVCECARLECAERIAMTPAEYEQLRSNPRRFGVRKGHEEPGIEHVVAENERFATIEKDEGEPAAVAERSDPRA